VKNLQCQNVLYSWKRVNYIIKIFFSLRKKCRTKMFFRDPKMCLDITVKPPFRNKFSSPRLNLLNQQKHYHCETLSFKITVFYFNIFSNEIYSFNGIAEFSASQPALRVTSSFRNLSNTLLCCSTKHFLLSSILKTVV